MRRKPVNRIEDSDSDIGSPAKPSSDCNAKGKENKIKYLTSLYPQNDVMVSIFRFFLNSKFLSLNQI